MKAFPASSKYKDEWNGMDLRDYFAAKAMPAIIDYWYKELSKDEEGLNFIDDDEISPSIESNLIAKECYVIADAMIKARSK